MAGSIIHPIYRFSNEVKMIEAQRYMKWKDALDYNNKMLDDVVKQSKVTNTAYQNYLKKNPHKNLNTELKQRKEKLIKRIIELTRQGYERYDGKT